MSGSRLKLRFPGRKNGISGFISPGYIKQIELLVPESKFSTRLTSSPMRPTRLLRLAICQRQGFIGPVIDWLLYTAGLGHNFPQSVLRNTFLLQLSSSGLKLQYRYYIVFVYSLESKVQSFFRKNAFRKTM